MPSNINVPIESMRCGAAPAADRPRSLAQQMRDMLDAGDGHNATFAYPPIRTCPCGAQVYRGSRADADHTRECGPEPGSAAATRLESGHGGDPG
jgi:hypothetical protein